MELSFRKYLEKNKRDFKEKIIKLYLKAFNILINKITKDGSLNSEEVYN